MFFYNSHTIQENSIQKGGEIMGKKQLTDEEKAKIAKRAYQRDWQRRNKDKVKEYAKRHFIKKYSEMEERGEL